MRSDDGFQSLNHEIARRAIPQAQRYRATQSNPLRIPRATISTTSNATMLEVEAGSIPGIYKIDSLAITFKLPLTQMLVVFGIDVRKTEQSMIAADPRETTLQANASHRDQCVVSPQLR
jgi:hypothetical protein